MIKALVVAAILVTEKVKEAKHKKAVMEEKYNKMEAEEFFEAQEVWD